MQLPIPVFALHIVLFYNNIFTPHKKPNQHVNLVYNWPRPQMSIFLNCLAILKPLGLITRQLTWDVVYAKESVFTCWIRRFLAP